MNSLMFQILIFTMGFVFLPKDANFSNSLSEKLGFIWHLLIPKVFEKKYFVEYIFKKYVKDKYYAEKLSKYFNEKYNLEILDYDKLQYKLIENSIPNLDLELDPLIFNSENHFVYNGIKKEKNEIELQITNIPLEVEEQVD